MVYSCGRKCSMCTIIIKIIMIIIKIIMIIIKIIMIIIIHIYTG